MLSPLVKTVLKWTLLTALLAYVVVGASWARDEARRHTVKDIDVEIAKSFSADSVTSYGVMAELKSFPSKIVGTPVHLLDSRALEKYLSAMPQFEEVNCNVTTSGTLKVRVVPMIPAARVFDGDRSYYINKEGKKMDSKADYFVDVPVIAGKFSEAFSPREVLPILRFIESDKVMTNLVGMVYAKTGKDIYLVPRIQGHMVNFGDTTRLEEKKEALLTFYRKVMPYKGWETYDTISVKYRGQVVATRRDRSRTDHGEVIDDGEDLEEATLPEVSPQAEV